MNKQYPSIAATRRVFLKATLASAAVAASTGRSFAAAAQAGAITVGSAVDIVNFDPYAQTTNALLILRSLNAWLIDYDEQLRPKPAALARYDIAADRASVTLTIRPDVTFHTGRKMTVDDVVFAIERALDPKRGFNLVAPTTAIVAGVKGKNAAEVVVALKEPTAASLITDLLANQPIVDATKNESASLTQLPASAGPYRVVDWRQGEQLVLEAFPEWFGGQPKTRRVVIRFFTSPSAAVTALASGSIDVLAYPPARDASRLKGDRFGILEGFPGAGTMLLRVNTKTAPFNNKAVRQALQRSVDRDRVVKEVLFGFGSAAFLPWGPTSPANDKRFHAEATYDLAAAKALMPGGLQGNALVSGSDPTSLLVMQMIQADLAKIGFDLKIEQADAASFQARLVAGDFGLVLGQVGGGQLSVPRIVQNSLMRVSNNPLWADGIPPKPYVEAIQTLIAQDDPAIRQRMFDQINRVLVDEAWGIGTYYVPVLFAHKADLKGVARDFQNSLSLADASF